MWTLLAVTGRKNLTDRNRFLFACDRYFAQRRKMKKVFSEPIGFFCDI
jgi:hypothetical protein